MELNKEKCYQDIRDLADTQQLSTQKAIEEYAQQQGVSPSRLKNWYYQLKKQHEPHSTFPGGKKYHFDKKECFNYINGLIERRDCTLDFAVNKYSKIHNIPEYAVRNAYYAIKKDTDTIKDVNEIPLEPKKECGFTPTLAHFAAQTAESKPATKDENHCPVCQEILTWCPNDGIKRCDSCGHIVPLDNIKIVPAEKKPSPDDFIDVVSAIVKCGQQANLDVEGAFAGLYSVFKLASAASETKQQQQDDVARFEEVSKKKEQLEQDISYMTRKVDRLEHQLKSTQEYVKRLEEVILQFMDLSTIQKVTSLQDFVLKLKDLVVQEDGDIARRQAI